MNTRYNKIQQIKSNSVETESPAQLAAGNSASALQDNRSLAAVQKKQAEDMANGNPLQRQANNTGLPDLLKSGIENLSGHSMDDVNVHYNSDKPAQLNAHAYAQGTDIHIASGQEKHLPHEAWHVVQQKQGRVQPTMQMKGKVNINDDQVLEKEADMMGRKAMQGRPAYPKINSQNRLHSIKSPMARILQPAWRETVEEPNATHKWDELMDGVIWYANNAGLMWFKIADAGAIGEGNSDDYSALEGEKNKRSWVAWNKQSIRPSPKFTADIDENGDYGLGHRDDSGDRDWDKWNEYMTFAIASAIKSDQLAGVHKDPDFNIESVPEGARDYIRHFKIITKQEYNIKLWEMAETLAKIGPYTCIVSEAGKSNFWVTARVLKKVQMLGGKAPKRVISVPTQEKGLMDAMMGPLSIDLSDAGNIVFLDDGSYSGAQLAKLITKVMAGAQNPVKIGLVAESAKAHRAIESARRNREYLATPYPIEEYGDSAALNNAQKALGFALHSNQGDSTHPDGNHMTALYYKVPDYASVRFDMLTKTGVKDGRTPLSGYRPGKGVAVPGGGIKLVDTSEPYKSGLGTKLSERALEIAVHRAGGINRADIGRPMVASGSMPTGLGLPRAATTSTRSKMSISTSSSASRAGGLGITTIPSMEESQEDEIKKGAKN